MNSAGEERITAEGITLTSILKNTTGDEMTLDFRWWNLFEPGKVSFGPVTLARTYDVRAYQLANPVKPIRFPRGGKEMPTSSISAPGARIVFGKTAIELAASPREAFNAFIVWDGTNVPPTLEPLFHPFTLNAGQQAEFTMRLTIRK